MVLTNSMGMREWMTERGFNALCLATSGSVFEPGLEEPAMFRLPAYDPVLIGWLGIGVLAVTALAFMP
jgi:hypothetical protein